MQINIGEVDATGRYTGAFKAYAISGFVRSLGESDDSLNRLATEDGFLKKYAFFFPAFSSFSSDANRATFFQQRLELPG